MQEKVFNLKNIQFSYFPEDIHKEHDGAFILSIKDMQISRGKLTSILGRSGSGKTTLLSILGLLRKPFNGEFEIYLSDEANLFLKESALSLWNNPRRAEIVRANYIGYALQGGELLSHLSLIENVEFMLKVLGREQEKSKLRGWLRRFYYQNEKIDLHVKPHEVSQGQYQRCALARALVLEPQIILADEPTGNLDIISSRSVLKRLREHVTISENHTVVLITHDMHNALEYSDEIFILANGKIAGHHIKNKDNKWARNIMTILEKQINSDENDRIFNSMES